MLTAADLGPDFSVAQIGPGSSSNSLLTACPALNDNPAGTTDDDAVALTDPASGTGLTVTEALFQVTPADATSDMAAFASTTTSCASFSGTLQGLTFDFTTGPLTVSPLGEQTTALRLTGTTTIDGQQIALYLDFVIILHHDTIIVAMVSENPPQITDTQTFATDAYTKVAALW